MSLSIKLRIGRLKRRARTLALNIHRVRDEYDCGAHLVSFLSPRVSQWEREFTETMNELAKIDPAAKALVDKEGTRI